MKKVAVIVSKCVNLPARGWLSYERVSETILSADDAEKAISDGLALGEKKCGKGLSVTVRPCFNERKNEQKFFREWRSFNDEGFNEVRWDTV